MIRSKQVEVGEDEANSITDDNFPLHNVQEVTALEAKLQDKACQMQVVSWNSDLNARHSLCVNPSYSYFLHYR